MKVDVLICGAGPTGLMLARQLRRRGVSVLIVDKKPGITHETKALGVQPRTLEVYDQLGLGEEALAQGVRVNQGSFWVRGKLVGSIPLHHLAVGLTPHDYVFMLTQDRNEALLCDGEVRWNTELTGFRQDAQRVTATLSDGTEVQARFLAGCDGAHSAVRKGLGLKFEGARYPQRFFVTDCQAEGSIRPGEVNLSFDDDGFRAFFPIDEAGRFRIVGLLPPHLRERTDLTFEDVREVTEKRFSVKVREVFWFSPYDVHHRVAGRFRLDRAFVLGDAAHVHSPVGAQGMNTGLQDAANLGWKIAAVLAGAPDSLLDSYEIERRPFALSLVKTTDRVFSLITHPRGALLRTVLPKLLLKLTRWFPALTRYAFRLISQTGIHYRHSPLSRLVAESRVEAGDRLPWVGELDNFRPLQSCDWQLHRYGGPEVEWDKAPVHHFPYVEECGRKGLRKGRLYLVRPDGYVAAVTNGTEPLDDYFAEILGAA